MKVVNRNTTALVEGDTPLLLPIRKVNREFWSEKSPLDALNGEVSVMANARFSIMNSAHPPHLPTRRLTGQHNTSLEEEGPRKFAAVKSEQPLRFPIRRPTGQHTTSIDDPYYSSSASTRFTTAHLEKSTEKLPSTDIPLEDHCMSAARKQPQKEYQKGVLKTSCNEN